MSGESEELTRRRRLTQVRLKRFKSVQDGTIDLSPLTVIVGANSSGKSTLLQGILLLTQAVESANTLDVPLNGERINLGYLSSVRNSAASASEPVCLGLTATFVPDRYRATYYLSSVVEPADEDDGAWVADYDLEFGRSAGTEIVSPQIRRLALSARPMSGDQASDVQLELRHRTGGGVALDESNFLGLRFSPLSDLSGDLVGTVSVADSKPTKVVAAGLRGAMPIVLAESKIEHAALAEAFIAHFQMYPFAFNDDEPAENVETGLDQGSIVDIAAEVLASWRRLPVGERPPIDVHIRTSITNRSVPFSEIQEAVFERRSTFVRQLARRLSPSDARRLVVQLRGREASAVAIAARGLGECISSIEHLGGLRAAPQPLYPTSNQAQRGHLGRDGEYTAAVLYAQRARWVASFDEDGNVERKTLEQAVKDWAARLELFEEVASHHRGALGIDISVRQAGIDDEVDITAVGLGVSQLLPVLVRCLLSEPDDTILLEQPELHLHPQSQQRLADFLLACVRSGRQLIVETHSEHLVNRLRLHAARAESEEIAELMTLVFAERDSTVGETTYRNVAVNPFGGLSEWPAGFMSEGIEDAQKLLESGLAKLKRKS